MSERSRKGRKRYVYYPRYRSKSICLIHGPENSSDKCKVLGQFGSKYAKSRPTKDCGKDTANRNKFNSQK